MSCLKPLTPLPSVKIQPNSKPVARHNGGMRRISRLETLTTHAANFGVRSLGTGEEDEEPIELGALDMVTCSDDEFMQHINAIRESTRCRQELLPKKKKNAKAYTKSQMEVIQEVLLSHQRALSHAKEVLQRMLGEITVWVSTLRRSKALLEEYYRTLEDRIESCEEGVLFRSGPYHRLQRDLGRVAPLQRYLVELNIVEERQEKLQQLLSEVEVEERDISITDSRSALGHREFGMGGAEGRELEGMYEDATAGVVGDSSDGNPEALLRMRALRPLLKKEQELRFVAPLPSSKVQSRLRKELILPFSVRVLALKMEDGNSMGDRFVEWYINNMIDPLAMAQLVELVPPDCLVSTTLRLAYACDTRLHLQQAQALPDISHVILQAVAEGRGDAVASLVLSSSGSYLRALEDKECMAIIFFTALITGQVEVLRRIMSVGFYNTNALIVWLFLNPNSNDPFYEKYMDDVVEKMRKFFQSGPRNEKGTPASVDRNFHVWFEDNFISAGDFNQDFMDSSWDSISIGRGMCEILQSFLHDRMLWKKSGSMPTAWQIPANDMAVVSSEGGRNWEATHTSSTKTMKGTIFTNPHSDTSFSSLLIQKKLNRLFLSAANCAVLPAVSTPIMRRVDPCGYTLLEATKSHLLLVGNTSTANAHVVRLPVQHTTLWNDGDVTEPIHSERRGEHVHAAPYMRGLKFYYEVHISLAFLLSDIPFAPDTCSTQFSASASNQMMNLSTPLQTSTVFVGWCSEERVASADGRSSQAPLGNDSHSIGISFDILRRSKIDEFTDEVVLRPMKHAMGRTSVFTMMDKNSEERDIGKCSDNQEGRLLRMRLRKKTLTSPYKDVESSFNSFSKESVYSASYSSLNSPGTAVGTCAEIEASTHNDSIVSMVYFVDEQEADQTGMGPSHAGSVDCGAMFSDSTVALAGVPVYDSHALVVGCNVDFSKQSASFTVNGTSLGVAFTVLPSRVALRPAVSVQASEGITTVLRRENPVNTVIVRFVFSKELLLESQAKFQNKTLFDMTMPFTPLMEVGDSETEKENSVDFIPGLISSSQTILFDESMIQCATLRLITGLDTSSSVTSLTVDDNNEDVHSLQNGEETLLLGSTLRVTKSSVQELLNASSASEEMLFFPPVVIRRRSDDDDTRENGVMIIPEDVPLVPLCVALTLRRRILAYHIAAHPLTDFHSTNNASVRQRRMALLAAASLGYEEILYVLLERMPVLEVLGMFALQGCGNQLEIQSSIKNGFRSVSSVGNTKVSPLTMLHRVEYTPLHCAILEGHQRCAHLLLYYINQVLSDENRKHAMDVMTRSGETALLMACRLGYTEIAKRLLSLGASSFSFDRVTRANCLELACASFSEDIALSLLQTPDYRSYVAVNNAGVASPLCWCALNNIDSIIQPLLLSWANPNLTLNGLTPLLLAVMFGSEKAALQLLRCCKAVANVSATKQSQSINLNSSHTEEATEDAFQVDDGTSRPLPLLEIDALDPRTQSAALHLACELGQMEVMRSLISKGASLNLQNKSTFATPLHTAIEHGHENMALEILEYAKCMLRRGVIVLDIAAINKNGDTPLHLSAREGMLPVIEYIMVQFNEEEIARLSEMHNFTKQPSTMNVAMANRQGRTPLLEAIHAHKEAAAQLIASLMPAEFPYPGGPVIDGTCVVLLTSDNEGLDNVTLFLLSHPRYTATEAFRDSFFARYNEKRLRMDLHEDGIVTPEETRRSVKLCAGPSTKRRDKRGFSSVGALQKSAWNALRGTVHVKRSRFSLLMVRERLRALSVSKQTNEPSLRITGTTKMASTTKKRRRSTFVRMLLAKGASTPSTRKSMQFLLQNFALEELYAMVDVISSESSKSAQSGAAMQYADMLVSFLGEYNVARIASSDAVMFARRLLSTPMLGNSVDHAQLEMAKRKLLDVRPLCRELFFLIRTYGNHLECVDEMRHVISQRGLSTQTLTEEATSPFGYTVLQLAATLGLSRICAFLIGECHMDPLYVPLIDSPTKYSFLQHHSESGRKPTQLKWLLTPFRLALRSFKLEVFSMFLRLDTPSDDISVLLERKESPLVDPLQQTALQEIVRQPLDNLSPESSVEILLMTRLLLRSGAMVQGNFDAEGNDAWMLAVCAMPGKGTKLRIFLEEGVELGDDDDDDDRDGEGESSTGLTVGNGANAASSVGSGCEIDKRRCEEYYVRLLFACAEHNPQSLALLLERYPRVLPLTVIHPLTGDTLVVFLLRRAVSMYAAECGTDVISIGDMTHMTQLTGASTLTSGEKKDVEITPYRDPQTIPRVRSLLNVVERLLQKFNFDNLYCEHEDGKTAIALAAQLSCMKLITLLLRRETQESTDSLVTSQLSFKELGNSSTAIIFESSSSINSKADTVNVCLVKNMATSNCWMELATRLYYAEEDMETLFTILRHIPKAESRFSFLSMVYPNLHPIVALHVTVLYSGHVKRFLMHPEANNAFWCNVLYVQYVGRFEEVVVTPAQWSSILSVLLPSASAVPIYLIKAMPLFPGRSGKDLLPEAQASTHTLNSSQLLDSGPRGSKKRNWMSVVKGTAHYIEQLAAAAAYIAAPTSLSNSFHGGNSIPSTQRHVLSAMGAHFHEVIELAVRFDNHVLLRELISLIPTNLHAYIKHEWNWLMRTCHLDAVAVSAGSINVLKCLADIPEAAVSMRNEYYDLIDSATGFIEGLGWDQSATELHHQMLGNSSTSTTPQMCRGGVEKIPENATQYRAGNTITESKNKGGKKAKEGKQAKINILAFVPSSSSGGNTETDEQCNEDGLVDAALQYTDVMAAARERTNASAVTWGIGAAARPVAIGTGSETDGRLTSSMYRLSSQMDHTKGNIITPTSTPTVGELFNPQQQQSKQRQATHTSPKSVALDIKHKKPLQSSKLEGAPHQQMNLLTSLEIAHTVNFAGRTLEVRLAPSYFAYYLCDWALHTTFLLHAPKPSVKAIDTVLHLMNQRAPLTPSVLHMFLVSSRPLNHWTSSEGDLITLNYISRDHKDSILHILVQNNQFQLTQYFLAAALYYFTCYQYDPPCTLPLQFPSTGSSNMLNLQNTLVEEVEKEKNETTGTYVREASYPAVFLRSMLRMNKHGLTPFDYARGSMVSLLMEYGCVPPSYRPNPRDFCREIYLPDPPSSFYKVPRVLLVSGDFLKLRDNIKTTNMESVVGGNASGIADPVLMRNQTISHRTTMVNVFPALLTDEVSLLHLGLCSASDELVLEHINKKRQKQLKRSISRQPPENSALFPSYSASIATATDPQLRVRSGLALGISKNPEKDFPNVLKLINILGERAFITFPLLLPEMDETGRSLSQSSSIALLLAMTPMTLMTFAHGAGAAKKSDDSSTRRKTERRPGLPHDQLSTDGKAQKKEKSPVLPRFTVSASRTRHPAAVLEDWITANHSTKTGTKKRHPHMSTLLRLFEKNITGRIAHALGLSIAPSYELSM